MIPSVVEYPPEVYLQHTSAEYLIKMLLRMIKEQVPDARCGVVKEGMARVDTWFVWSDSLRSNLSEGASTPAVALFEAYLSVREKNALYLKSR